MEEETTVTRIKSIAALATLAIVLGALPALADEAGEAEDGDEATEQLEPDSPLAMLLAAEFGITVEEVTGLRDLGLGFGDIFKLKTLTTVLGVEFDTLLAGAVVDPVTGEYDFGWGELKQTLNGEQLALLASLPRNLGAIVSAANRHHGGNEHQGDPAAANGKPDFAGNGGKHGSDG